MPGEKLEDGTEKEVEGIIRKFLWDTVHNLRAVDTVSAHERDLISADKELMRDIEKEGSFLEMLGVSDSEDGLLGESDWGFDDKHMEFVKHILRGAGVVEVRSVH